MLEVTWGLFDSPFYILYIAAVGYLPSPIECRVTIGGFVADMYLGSESPDMPAGGTLLSQSANTISYQSQVLTLY